MFFLFDYPNLKIKNNCLVLLPANNNFTLVIFSEWCYSSLRLTNTSYREKKDWFHSKVIRGWREEQIREVNNREIK